MCVGIRISYPYTIIYLISWKVYEKGSRERREDHMLGTWSAHVTMFTCARLAQVSPAPLRRSL